MTDSTPAPRRPTIRDVADRAGVHPATASRALNPALPGRIGAETTRRVRQAAEELGYQPDPTARSLRTRRSGTVGVVVPDLTNPVLPPIIRAIEEVLWEAGLACLLADTDNRVDRETALVDELLARRCEGLIIASAARDSAAVGRFLDGAQPAVLVTREPDGNPLPFVGGDDSTGVATAVSHLFDLGHRDIGYLTGPPELSTTRRREEAFRVAMATELGVEDPKVVHGSGFTVAAGEETCHRLLAAHPEVTAVMAGNDLMALGVYEALAASGRRCPDDTSVVGHNDMPFMARVAPPLTTVSIPQHEVGAIAARMLLALLDGRRPEPDRHLVPTTLVVRASTAPA